MLRVQDMVKIRPDSRMRTAMRQEGCHEEFAELYAVHEQHVFAYILALTGNVSVAEDVFQETCVVLWQKFDEFELGTNFAAWARRIARNMVMRHHRQVGKQQLVLNNGFVETMAVVGARRAGARDSRSKALQGCLTKLGQRDSELLACRYRNESLTIKEVAERLGRPANTVYKALRRIRASLLECVRRTLSQGEYS
jgi:RNA polymerase sigma-70 factor (ECF subfamily)